MCSPYIHDSSDDGRVTGGLKSSRGILRSGVENEKKVSAALLAPRTSVTVSMPNKIDGAVKKGWPGKYLDPFLPCVHAHDGSSRYDVRHGIVVDSNPRKAETSAIAQSAAPQNRREKLGVFRSRLTGPWKRECLRYVWSLDPMGWGGLNGSPLLQNPTIRGQFDSVPFKDLLIGKTEAISQTQHLLQAGKSSGFDAGKRSVGE